MYGVTYKASNQELSVMSGVFPCGIGTLHYIRIKRRVREIARRHEGVAKYIIG